MREKKISLRGSLSLKEIKKKSEKILFSLAGLPEIEESDIIFTYVNFRSEVLTIPFINMMLEKGKKITVPLTVVKEKKLLAVHLTAPEKELHPGYRGIPEPLLSTKNYPDKCIDPALIEAVIIPGSVFDYHGGRLGYGGGYYDRFLSNDAPGAVRIGLAFHLQMVDRLELQPHDQLMDIIITEKEIYYCERGNV